MAAPNPNHSIASLTPFIYEEAQRDFVVFLNVLWPQHRVEEHGYYISDVHAYLAEVMQDMLNEEEDARATVSMPPQHGKSRIIAVRAVAWALGAFPGIQVAMTGFSHQLLCEFIAEVMEITRMPVYKKIFKNVYTTSGASRADYKKFKNGSGLVCKSAGTKLTGRRVDLLIVDDPHAGRAEAESPASRRRILEWYFADCMSRLSANAKVVVIGTRWHPDDLIGNLTSDEYIAQMTSANEGEGMQYEVVNLPALADHDPSRGEEDPLGREVGDPLFPEERPKKFLLKVKNSIPAYEWNSQFMGKPTSSMSGEADLSKIKYINEDEVPWEDIEMVRGWDLAITESQMADFTVGALCGWHHEMERFYILNIFRRRMAWAKLREHMLKTSYEDLTNHDVCRIGIEGVAGFKTVYQEIKKSTSGDIKVEKRNPAKGGKLLRAQPWLNKIEGGNVYMIRSDWTKEFIDELGQFPDSKHDDQVDAVSVAHECLCKKTKIFY